MTMWAAFLVASVSAIWLSLGLAVAYLVARAPARR